MNSTICNDCCNVRWPVRARGAIAPDLTFWLHLLRQGKRWKEDYYTL